ncbi:hypothetical protein K461DRAFT_256513 [Myriangium duriaei CBS 260.36]|uniref:Uncharacterized protein n=1 Tax=Myriangium duriaei CBS 260.36 TaxID=1168546 RepID=A0A9P4MGX1_9PEZI|nr:hypothetical protein K461DRAFT_256513 [Myriangium duriaei CBS 260.36]
MAPSRDPAADDPVISEYDIFITPSLDSEVYVLQFPIRSRRDPYDRQHGCTPAEMRLKPKSGFAEVDVDLDPQVNFNKHAGLQWGEAMRRAKTSGLSTFGAAAGFGPGTIKPEGRRRVDEYAEPEVDRFEAAVNEDKVFTKQTVGGQILRTDAASGGPQYMLGTFRGKQLHLTRVDGIAQMRPQFHHIDAVTHVDRATAAQRDPDEAPRAAPQARGFTQSYRQNRDDGPRTATEKNLMQLAAEEKWTRLNYFDEEDSEAYDAYANLFVEDPDSAEQLFSSMSNEEYLDAISVPRHDPGGRRKKKPLTRRQREAIDLADEDADPVEDLPAEDE